MTVDVGDGLGDGDGETDGDGDIDGDGEALGDAVAEGDADAEGEGEGDDVASAAESAAIIGNLDLSSNVWAWRGVRVVTATPTSVAATATTRAGPSVRNNFTRSLLPGRKAA